MVSLASIDWSSAPSEDRIRALKVAPSRQVCAMARAVRWDATGLDVISWISAQQGVDLGSALTLFLHGDPQRFNDVPRNAVAQRDRRACSLLDALCQRINAGFYLPDPARPVSEPDRLLAYLRQQREDTRQGLPRRWGINETVLAPLLTDSQIIARRKGRQAHRKTGQKPGLFGNLISPRFG
ncbi:hypothetical protein [Pseudooceanicola aestuarii]|uniref:hypothetical protein n=1 Tax=Pseudooceanicola aestuarii TaxID=2697319 RepID=UPI0013D695EC|nr:hypothetical protein [Pseudooceanicola aestuarii]